MIFKSRLKKISIKANSVELNDLVHEGVTLSLVGNVGFTTFFTGRISS